MSKLFKNLLPHWKVVLLLVVLLIGQAYCDLSLPQYTQDIIDVGIQNRGMEHIIPEKITASEYRSAMIFMDKSEAKTWKNCYRKSGKHYVRTINDEERLDELDSELMTPIVLTYQLGHTKPSSFRKTVKQNLEKSVESSEKKLDKAEKAAKKAAASSAGQIPSGMTAGGSASQAKKLQQARAQIAKMKKVIRNIDSMSISEIGDALGMDIKTFKAKDEDGNVKTYVDMRSMLQTMIDEGKMDESTIRKAKKQMNDTIESAGDSQLKSMGLAYAADCEEKAGMDVDRIQKDYLWYCGRRMFFMAAMMLLFAVSVAFFASRVGAEVGRDLRSNLFRTVIRFSNTEIDQFSSASLITRCTNDIQQIQLVTTLLLRMILYAPVLGIWGIIKAYQTGANMEWVIALGVLVIMGFVAVLMSVTLPKFKIMQKLTDNLNRVSREILTGLSVIRAFGREKTEEERFDAANTDLTRTQLFTNRVMTLMQPTMTVVMNALVVLITWVSANRIDAGEMQVGAMTAFITYAMMIVMAFLMLTMVSIILPRAGVAAERVDEVLKTKSSIVDPEEPESFKESSGEVVFSHVDFRYPGAGHNVLTDIDFTAKPGETTAIIGSTGSGKSTLVNLLPRFYDVTGGRITLDGEDVRNVSMHDLRSRIGFVPQKGVLFSGSVAYNIRFGKKDATEEEVRDAARIAQAEDFVDKKEQGFESMISQGGSNVSGGQKQRLAIARAVVRKPEVLVFDDSFSALDMKTDANLRKALAETSGDSTKIIVAQRISTILHADQILVLDEGRVVGKGTHAELMKSCEVYQQIAKSQLSSMELETI